MIPTVTIPTVELLEHFKGSKFEEEAKDLKSAIQRFHELRNNFMYQTQNLNEAKERASDKILAPFCRIEQHWEGNDDFPYYRVPFKIFEAKREMKNRFDQLSRALVQDTFQGFIQSDLIPSILTYYPKQ